jgi:phosphoglycerate kinase
MYKEFQALKHIVLYGKKPITAIIGGAKVSSKIDIIVNILPLIDHLLIAGGMAFTFIKVLEGNIGNSIVEYNKKRFVFETFQKSFRNKVHVYLPIDVIIADSMNKDANIKEQFTKKISKKMMGLDIGKKSIHEFSKIINRSLSIFWNGPLGVFEITNFSNGTLSIINIIKNINLKGAFSMVGGGDSILSIKKYKDNISYISTGGGAMLEILKGKIIPGIEAIVNN